MTFEDHDHSAPHERRLSRRPGPRGATRTRHGAAGPSEAEAWYATAGSLEWTCWETAEHLTDDLVFQGRQIGTPGLLAVLPPTKSFNWAARHPQRRLLPLWLWAGLRLP